MKILQVVHSQPFYSQAGTEIYTQGLSCELSKKNEVYIFCRVSDTRQRDYAVKEKDFGKIKVFSINNTFKHCNSFEAYYENHIVDEKFSRLLDDIKPDIVHIQHLVFLSTGLIMKIKERGIPVVFTLHDYWLMCPRWHVFRKDNRPCIQALAGQFNSDCPRCLEEVFHIGKGLFRLYRLGRNFLPQPFLNAFKKIYFSYMNGIAGEQSQIGKLKRRASKIKDYLENVDIFLAPSGYLKERFVEFGIPIEKIRLLRTGLRSGLVACGQKTETDKIRFAFIGTLLPAKGLHVLIEAFNGVKDDKAELRIFGKLYSYAGFEEYPSYLKKIIKNRNIRFMGGFEHNRISDIFKEIDVLIVPSLWYENSPLVIGEALLSGTPVIASRIGGIPELIRDGENGFLFNPGDTVGLRKQIIFMINNRRVIEELSVNPSDIKNIEDNCLEIEDIYFKLVNKNRAYDYSSV